MQLFTHETETLQALLEKNFRPAVIYDIGASNGVWSDVIALTLPECEYHLFEPLTETVVFYRDGLHERLARRPRFHLHTVALSDRRGTARVFATHDGFGSSLLDRGAIPEVATIVETPVYPLDGFVEERNLAHPDVMKLDVQGGERLILAGGPRALQHASVLFLETWLQRGYGPETPLLTEMIEYLGNAGFRLTALGEQFKNDRGHVNSVDAVFYSDALIERLPH
jgi:FkbM family methyltransferase